MDEKRNNRTVERRLKEALKHDRARIQVGHISHFGLMEMSRQRIRSSVLESSTEKCPHCGGTGHVRSVSSVALQLLRALDEMLMKGATHNLVVRTRSEIALYLLNHKRAHLRALEERFQIAITGQCRCHHRRPAVLHDREGRTGAQPEQAKALAAQPLAASLADAGRRRGRRLHRRRRRGRAPSRWKARRSKAWQPPRRPTRQAEHDPPARATRPPAPARGAAVAAKAASRRCACGPPSGDAANRRRRAAWHATASSSKPSSAEDGAAIGRTAAVDAWRSSRRWRRAAGGGGAGAADAATGAAARMAASRRSEVVAGSEAEASMPESDSPAICRTAARISAKRKRSASAMNSANPTRTSEEPRSYERPAQAPSARPHRPRPTASANSRAAVHRARARTGLRLAAELHRPTRGRTAAGAHRVEQPTRTRTSRAAPAGGASAFSARGDGLTAPRPARARVAESAMLAWSRELVA